MIAENLVLYLLIYKIVTLICGGISIYLGYKLFVKGIFTDAGELTGKFGDNQIALKKAAPGTFFSLFGTVIICYTVFTGFHLNGGSKTTEPVIDPEEKQETQVQTSVMPDTTTNVPKADTAAPKTHIAPVKRKPPQMTVVGVPRKREIITYPVMAGDGYDPKRFPSADDTGTNNSGDTTNMSGHP